MTFLKFSQKSAISAHTNQQLLLLDFNVQSIQFREWEKEGDDAILSEEQPAGILTIGSQETPEFKLDEQEVEELGRRESTFFGQKQHGRPWERNRNYSSSRHQREHHLPTTSVCGNVDYSKQTEVAERGPLQSIFSFHFFGF